MIRSISLAVILASLHGPFRLWAARSTVGNLEKQRFDKALLSAVEGLSANDKPYKTVIYPFMLSLSKALLSAVEGYERMVFRGSR